MNPQRTILHIDMNAYFASVEQRANPHLRGKPIIVCGQGRTVVTTASYEARKCGVKTGMTIPEAKKLCPDVICVIGNPIKYIDTSKRIYKILLEFTNRVEVYSIDEAFMDVSDCKNLFGDGENIARRIKERLKEEIGLTCSMGVAPNKLLSKLASGMQKPDGLVLIKHEDIPKILEKTPVEDLCGIGVKISSHLNSLGIKTVKQLGDTKIDILTRHFGFWGHILKKMGKGEDENPVSYFWEDELIKSIGHSHTLPRDTWDTQIIEAYLLMLSEKVAVRLREANLIGRTIALTIRYSDFHTFTRHLTIKHYIKTGYEIYLQALKLLNKIRPFKKAIRLIGVSISNLIKDEKQLYLLETYKNEERITKAVDLINKKFGEFTIKPSSLLFAENFGRLSLIIPPRRHISYERSPI